MRGSLKWWSKQAHVINAGSGSALLSEVTLRYWLTRDTPQTISVACDYAAISCANITRKSVVLSSALPGADSYIEVGFSSGAGSLAPGAQTGIIQMRANKADWSNFNESDDYSFDSTKTAFSYYSRVTMYRNGVLIWGKEPGIATATLAVPTVSRTAIPVSASPTNTAVSQTATPTKTTIPPTPTPTLTQTSIPATVTRTNSPTSMPAFTSTATRTSIPPTLAPTLTRTSVPVTSTLTLTSMPGATPTVTSTPVGFFALQLQYMPGETIVSDSQIGPYFNLINAGTTNITLSQITFRYWLTRDTPQNLAIYCDYAAISCANITRKGVYLSTPLQGADAYIEYGFTSAAGTLTPGNQTGIIQTRANKVDWSSFNESDDYSFDSTKTAPGFYSRVTAYRNGVLIWGKEPSAITPTTQSGIKTSTPVPTFIPVNTQP